jgi:hypothetical protein
MAAAGVYADNDPPEGVDTDAMLALIGRHSVAHACPVSENMALTAAHVIDLKWYDPDFALVPYRFQNEYGEDGLAIPRYVVTSSDFGFVELQQPVSHFFPVATSAPNIGDMVWWVEFELRNKKEAFFQNVRSAKIVNVVAGTIYTDRSPMPGASGGCLLNESNEVLGVVSRAWMFSRTYGKYEVGDFTGVYPPWTPEIPDGANAEKEGEAEGEQEQEEVDSMYGPGYPYADEGNIF